MTKEEIKKALYKEKPIAKRTYTVHEYPKMQCAMLKGEKWGYTATLNNGKELRFEIPCYDMGEKPFNNEESAQLLIRWLI